MNEALSSVLGLATLDWPADLDIPSKRFRLFVAADVSPIGADVLAEFATRAIERGMVYFSAWGPDCERFHDIVDEVRPLRTQELELVMTTWHANETLEEALEFFIDWARPDEGLIPESRYWLALSLNRPEWENTIRRELNDAQFPPE